MKYFSTLAIILSLTLGFSCRKASDDKQKNQTANILLREQVETLDPANSYDQVSAHVVYQVYEQLYEYHYLKRPYTLQPLLADALPVVSEDGKTYTIKIKQNVRYHNLDLFPEDRPRFVKAEDFITQIKRIALTKTRSNGWFLFKGRIEGLDDFRTNAKTVEDIRNINVSGLSSTDDNTLVIKLTAPYPQLRYVLAMSFTTPVPYEAVVKYNNNLMENVTGTGPFILDNWNRGLDLDLSSNPYYRTASYPSQGDRFANANNLLKDAGKTIPFIKKIKFKIMKENQTQWLNFLNQKIDYLDLPKDNFDTAINIQGSVSDEMKNKGIQLQVVPTLTYWWVAFNMNHPILGKNLKLRQAVAHAINVEEYIKLFTNNVGQKANSIYTPGIPGYNPSTNVNFTYDMNKAKQLLVEAGHPNGEDLPEFTYDVRGSSTLSRQMGEFIKNELGKIGIKLSVVVNTFPGFLKKLRGGNLQMWLDGWALDYPDAENISQLIYSESKPPGPNHSFYNKPEVDQLIEKLKYLNDGEEKFTTMRNIEKLVFEDMPWVLLFYKRNYVLYHDHLKNFRKSDLVPNYLKYIKINK